MVLKSEVQSEATSTGQKLEDPQMLSEERMGKHELIELDKLKILNRDPKTKRCQVFCPYCQKTVQGRNRAQVWQHCSGTEHRRRWKAGDESMAQPVQDSDAQEKGCTRGKCEGLQLGGEFGKKTILGGDLLEVWRKYAKFANLERLGD